MAVTPQQRFSQQRRCPVCGGWDSAPRGQGIRCYGFLSDGGGWVHCTREDHAGKLDQEPNSQTYAHRLTGDCRCGREHGTAPVKTTAFRQRPRSTLAEDDPGSPRQIVATYDYRDEHNAVRHRTVRYEPKDFRQWQPDGRGGWIKNLGGVERVLYRLPELLAAPKAVTVYIVEGEKDADALARIGLIATTNAEGARSAWHPEYSATLAGRSVVVLPDNDDPGRQHAAKVAQALQGIAASVQIVTLPDLAEKGDVSDWLAGGGTRAELERLVEQTPEWKPAGEVSSDSIASVIVRPEPDVLWPDSLDLAAFHGLAGEIVRTIEPHTEADPAALLIQFLVMFGSTIGSNAHFTVEADRHALNLYAALVGETAKARKGTSLGHIRRLFKLVDEEWDTHCVTFGLSSGEGLIWNVRDAIVTREPIKDHGRVVDYQDVETDPGITDKRRLVIEEELAGALRVLGREGNTLSAVIRKAWDDGNLRILTKNSPATATGAHISVIAHITRSELLRYLTSTEAGNGFANRLLWVSVRRSKVLPEGGRLHAVDLEPLVRRLAGAVAFAKDAGELRRDEQARTEWRMVYPALSEGKPGLFGAVTARAEAQTMRLAASYALLDQSTMIGAVHLRAALAVWQYAEDSARFIFGDATGDPVADELRATLQRSPEGLTRTEIRDLFGRHQHAGAIERALAALRSRGQVTMTPEDTGGRPTERWRACDESDESDQSHRAPPFGRFRRLCRTERDAMKYLDLLPNPPGHGKDTERLLPHSATLQECHQPPPAAPPDGVSTAVSFEPVASLPPGALPPWLYDRVWGVEPALPPPPGMTPEEVTAAVARVRATLPSHAAPAVPSTPIRYALALAWAEERGWLRVRDPFTGEWHEIAAKDAPRSWLAELRQQGRTSDG